MIHNMTPSALTYSFLVYMTLLDFVMLGTIVAIRFVAQDDVDNLVSPAGF